MHQTGTSGRPRDPRSYNCYFIDTDRIEKCSVSLYKSSDGLLVSKIPCDASSFAAVLKNREPVCTDIIDDATPGSLVDNIYSFYGVVFELGRGKRE
jgi:hypothetical protein